MLICNVPVSFYTCLNASNVDAVWGTYDNTEDHSKTAYLLVHSPGDKLFQSFMGKHAEEKFIEVYEREEGYEAGNERQKLDMYFKYAPCGSEGRRQRDCATELRDFAENNNFELNIKAAAPYQDNEEELSYLMTSQYCTVEAFTEQDYRNLATYLGFPLSENWEYTPDMIERDYMTWVLLHELHCSKYDLII